MSCPMGVCYPKRAASIGDDAPGDQLGEGGSTPTGALHHQLIGPCFIPLKESNVSSEGANN